MTEAEALHGTGSPACLTGKEPGDTADTRMRPADADLARLHKECSDTAREEALSSQLVSALGFKEPESMRPQTPPPSVTDGVAECAAEVEAMAVDAAPELASVTCAAGVWETDDEFVEEDEDDNDMSWSKEPVSDLSERRRRFLDGLQSMFGLSAGEALVGMYPCSYYNSTLVLGKILLSDRHICFAPACALPQCTTAVHRSTNQSEWCKRSVYIDSQGITIGKSAREPTKASKLEFNSISKIHPMECKRLGDTTNSPCKNHEMWVIRTSLHGGATSHEFGFRKHSVACDWLRSMTWWLSVSHDNSAGVSESGQGSKERSCVTIPLSSIWSMQREDGYRMTRDSIIIMSSPGSREHFFTSVSSCDKVYPVLRDAWRTVFGSRLRHIGTDDQGTPSKASAAYPLIDADNKKATSFQKLFGLPPTEELVDEFSCHVIETFPRTAKMYLTERFICLYIGSYSEKKITIPFGMVKCVVKERDSFAMTRGLIISDFFDRQIYLRSMVNRDLVFHRVVTLWRNVVAACQDGMNDSLAADEANSMGAFGSPVHVATNGRNVRLSDGSSGGPQAEDAESSPDVEKIYAYPGWNGSKSFRLPNMTICMIIVGSRGDVQPFIAFGKELQRQGHTVRIATHECFRQFVGEHGLQFHSLGGDPKELMSLCIENGTFTLQFMRESIKKFWGVAESWLADSWAACQGVDAIIQTPSALNSLGWHIGEALGVPYYVAFTMPFCRTSAFPHPFLIGAAKGALYNYYSYILIENLFWQPLRGMINKWRVEQLGIPPIPLGAGGSDILMRKRVPFLYCFSPSVVDKPKDWPEWIHVTGYWFLDDLLKDYTPDPRIVDFLAAGTKPLYIGFGSIVISNPDRITAAISGALRKTNSRAIIVKGWGGISNFDLDDSQILLVDSVPHDWLFPQVSAAVHHGGAGTSAAAVRAGIPSIIVPFFGDQYFWGEKLVKKDAARMINNTNLTAANLAVAIVEVTTKPKFKIGAELLGDKISAEDGVKNAVEAFYSHLPNVVRRRQSSISNEKNSLDMAKSSHIRAVYADKEGGHSLHTQIWLTNDQATSCMKCASDFSFKLRRHHCRSCGGIFCSACSSHREKVPKFGCEQPVRVCDGCYQGTLNADP